MSWSVVAKSSVEHGKSSFAESVSSPSTLHNLSGTFLRNQFAKSCEEIGEKREVAGGVIMRKKALEETLNGHVDCLVSV